eukprot:2025445-Rhodomonas_salina.1
MIAASDSRIPTPLRQPPPRLQFSEARSQRGLRGPSSGRGHSTNGFERRVDAMSVRRLRMDIDSLVTAIHRRI